MLSRIPFWLYQAGEVTTVRAGSSQYVVGEPISISWRAAPGLGLDWLGVYRCDADGCNANTDYLLYVYTHAAIEGRATIGPDAQEAGASWPLEPGRYVVRLLTDDSYQDLATSDPSSFFRQKTDARTIDARACNPIVDVSSPGSTCGPV